MKRRLLMAMITLLTPAMLWAQTININKAEGHLESAFVEWQPVSGADSYNVYYSGGGVTDQKIDDQLIRSYGSYLRADALGLKAGSYTLKIAAVVNGSEEATSTTSSLTVVAHDRTGFAFSNGHMPGGYNADGTVKSGAIILYLTENTKNTVELEVTGANSNPCIGLQAIFDGFKKGKDNRSLIVRMIGQVTNASNMQSGDFVIENSNNFSSHITFEGVGEDATADGWGIRIKNAANVEIRNIGSMNIVSSEGDNIGLQQNNDYIWVHNVDFFYGGAGGDSDQAKGDGALDCKKSRYVTFSYNHFWDSGKSNLLGLSEGGMEGLYITYHHNWYDHSDSRHPRVRYYSAHVYNNYYDGNAKYGIGSTNGSSILAEGNYFRNCKYPILTSMQGSDIFDESTGQNDAGDLATFSSEDGGSIKAVNNYMEGQRRFVPYGDSSYPNSTVDFDAYVVSSPTDAMPSSVQSSEGGNFHDNFNTSSVMYSYSAQSPSNARSSVIQYAGRMNGGDFNWIFNNSVDDASSAVNTALKSALVSYQTKLKSIQGEGDIIITPPEDFFVLTTNTSGSGTVSGAGTYDAGTTVSLTATAASGWSFSNWSGAASGSSNPLSISMDSDKSVSAVFTEGDIVGPPPTGDYDHNFTASGLSSSFYSIAGNLSTSKGTVNYAGLTLTQCLKIESSTSISFLTSAEGTLTLVFNDGWNGNFKIDGNDNSVSSGILTVTLSAGNHTLTKGDSGNLYFMSLDLGDGGSTTYYALSTTINGQGSIDPANGSFESGTSVAMTATPASGWQFDNWSGGSTTNPANVLMDDDKNITANFSQIITGTTYTLSTSVIGQGSISGGGTYNEGTSVSLTAHAASGYAFTGWSGAASGSSNPVSVTMSSNKSITANFEEEDVVVGDGFFVSTSGNDSNSGSSTSPFKTLQKAIEVASAGDYIYVRGGTHVMTQSSVVIQKDGTSNANIHVFAYGNEVPVLSFDDVEVSSSRGIVQDGDYWHWKGITIEKAGDNGMLLSGNNNTIENCIFRKNNDTGLQLSRYSTSADNMSLWPSNNLIVGCESFDNADSDSEDADGFAAKLTSGTGNVFKSCVAHHNIDDGWDLYTKSDTGPIGKVIFEDCIAHNNGILTDGNTSGGGDKNGFKLGSSAHNIDHELRRCIAYGNGKHGFTDNGNVGNVKFYNLTSYDNAEYNFHTRDNASHTFRNCISFDGGNTDRIRGDSPTSCNALTETDIDWTVTASSSDFVTMTEGPNSDPTSNGFLNLKSSSALIDAGCSASGVSGNGSLDIGAIEYGGVTVINYTISTSSNGNGSVSGGGTYQEGSVVSLNATATSGYQFDGWSGDASGSTNPLSVTVNENRSITASFSQVSTTQYTINANSNGNGSVSGGGTFDEGSTIQLTASPNSGYQFVGWSGDASGLSNPLSVTLNGNKSISASFTLIPTGDCELVVYQMEDGTISNGSVDSNNAGYNGTGFANTDNSAGEYVEIVVNVPSARVHDLTLRYAATSDRPAEVSVNGSSQLSSLGLPSSGAWATWATVGFTLDLQAGDNTIRFTANGSSGLPNLDEMTVCQGGEDLVLLPTIALSAVESNGSIVLNWTVSDGVVNSQQVYRDTDSDPSGRVRIAQAINGSNYTDATAEEGTTYYYWIKASAAIDGSSVNSNSADATIPVVIVNYTLSTVVNGQGSVTPNGGMFEEGTSVTLIATPASGWQFDSWSGGFTGTSATVVMDSDKSVTANFLQIVNQVTISIQEDASGFCGVDGSVDSNNSGFTGAGFANTSNASGNGIEYSISASAGSATLVIQYANGSSDRPANIIINGSQQGSALSFASTGSWSTWSSVTTTVTLNEGVNSIRLEATVSGGLGNIDYIELSGNNVSGASCSSSARLSTVPSSAIAVSAINVQVYPNPVVDRLSISTEGTIDKVEVYNMIGSLVNRVEVQFNSIDISQLHAGQYILKVFTPEGTSVHRVIKQ